MCIDWLQRSSIINDSSREVAEMMGKEHKHILQYIEGNKDVAGIRPVLESQGLDSQNYFIPSTYRAW